MAKKKTYYDPQDGRHYYHGESMGASNWGAPESDKDETHLNQYNYTPSYNAYRQYLEEEQRRLEEERRRQQMQAAQANRLSQDPGALQANTAQKLAMKQGVADYNNIMAQHDPNFVNKPAEEKYNMFVNELKRQDSMAGYSQGKKEWASRLSGDPEFDRMSEDEKNRQYMKYLENTADEKGTLPELQRAELSEYKYNQLTDKERNAVDAFMRLRDEDYDLYTEGGEQETKFADPTGRGNYSQKRYQEATKAAEEKQAARERTLNDVRAELKHLGWDDAKIDKELARYGELVDFKKTQEKIAKNDAIINDPNLTDFEKAMVGAGYTAADFLTFLPRNVDTFLSDPYNTDRLEKGAYGRNTSSKYSSLSRKSEAATSQIRENIGNKIGQAAYDMGVSSGESMTAMMMAKALGPAGEIATLLPFAVSAYDNSYRDAVNRGFSEQQAQGYGIFVGGLEALTEEIPFERLGKMAEGKKVGRNLVARALAQMGIEGAEEMTSEIGQAAGDYLAVKIGKTGKTQFQLDVENNMAQGMTEEEAKGTAIRELGQRVLEAGLAGAGSALPNTAIASTVGAINNSMRGGNINKAISDRYQSLEVKGESDYEKMLQADKEKYQNNPTQFVVDQYKAQDADGEKIKQGLQEIADKEKAGKKLTISDKAFISENAQINQDFVDKLYDTGEQEKVPYKYREVKQDISEDDARRMLAEAAGSGDAKAFIDAMRATRNSSNEDVAKRAEEIISLYSEQAQAHGITKEDIGKAMLSEKRAYLAGLNGEQLNKESMTDESKIAYNEGLQENIAQKARTVVSSQADIQNVVVGSKDGNQVTLAGSFDEKGIKTSTGESISMDNLDLSADSAVSRAYQYADRYDNVNVKNAFMSNIKDGQNIEQYKQAFDRMYDSAMAGVTYDNAKKSVVAKFADEDVLKAAYITGQTEASARSYDSLAQALGDVKAGTGKVVNESSAASADMVDFYGKLARRTGLTFKIVDQLDQEGARGSFQVNKSTITVRADKADVVFHELGEFTETYNKKEYDALRTAIANFASEKMGNDKYMRMMRAYKSAYAMAGQDASADEMSGEMFNDTISIMMRSDKGRDALAKFLAKNYEAEEAKTIGQQAADFVKRLAGAVKKAFGVEKKNVYEAEMSKYADELGKYADQFLTALDGAIENYQKAGKGVGDGGEKFSIDVRGHEIETNEDGTIAYINGTDYVYDINEIKRTPHDRIISATQEAVSSFNQNIAQTEEKINAVTEEMAIHYDAQDEMVYPTDYSLETWSESEYQQDKKNAAKELSKAMGISQKKALKYIDDINSIARIIADDRVRLDYDSDEGSAVVSNSDYGASVDFSTICKKRLLYTGTLQQIQKQIGNRVITVDDYLAIRQAMLRDNLETTCGCCYVEGSRAKLGGFMKEFIRKYAKTKPEYVPTMYDVSTPDGIRQLRTNHPEVYKARDYFLNHYGRIDANDTETLFASQQKPKDYTERKAYKGEILKMFKGKKDKVADKNLNGGLRLQSFSDFEVVNLLDCMQVITDMSRVGLAGQAYTKVKNFADALGNTGLKINLSLMAKGVDKNGNLILDEINGMKKSDAEYLRNKYSKNVGTIIVCFTDEQIKAAMKDNMIDFIIPFHRSQWQKSQYEALGLPEGTKDYTNYQEDGVIGENGRRKRADHSYMSKEYWDFSKSGRENAETYIKMCNDNNKVPVFDFLLEKDSKGKYVLPADADGYFKLLIDFKMYDNDGVGSPQMPVRPDFSLDECRQMLMDYEGGHESFPVNQKIADEFTKKITKREKEFKYSLDVDSEGNKLTEGQAKYFKDSVIRDENGNLKIMYHGTQNNFTIFDPKKLGGKNGTAEGFGIYFTENPEISQAYGGNQMKGYLNVTNPARYNEKTIKAKDLTKLVKAAAEAQAKDLLEEGYDSLEEAVKDSWISNIEYTYDKPIDQVYRLVAQKILSMNSNDMDIIQEIMADMAVRDYEDAYKFYDILQDTLGIDGFITEWEDSRTGEKNEVVVAIDSNQFKNIDNESPTENSDIRFSLDVDSEGNSLSEDQKKYFENSQIRDENGNLKVMYHGSNAGGFTVFDPQKADDKISLFFTDNADVADSYIHYNFGETHKRPTKYKSDIPRITNIEDAVAFLEKNGYTNFNQNTEGRYPRWSFNDPSMGGHRIYEWSQKDIIAEANSLRKGSKGLYKVYLDVQNPLVVDGGNKIEGVVDDVVIAKQRGDFGHIIAFNYDTPTGTETIKKNKADVESYIEDTFGNDTDRIKKAVEDLISNGKYYEGKHLKNVYVNTVVPSNWNNIRFNGGKANTRYIAGYAHEHGYDGVYFKNITDNGGASGDYQGASDIVVAFNSDQVKAVDNMHPTTDPDIRYSIDIDSEGRTLTEGQQRYFNNTKVVDDNGALKVMYHGARGAGFTVFDPDHSDDGRSLFFTDDPRVAKSYVGTFEKFKPLKPMTFDELASAMEGYTYGEIYLEEDGNDVVIMEVGAIQEDDKEVYRGNLKGAQEYFIDSIKDEFHNTDANYEVYLNLQNPYIMDAKGANWDELNDDVDFIDHFGDVDITKTDAGYEVEWMGKDFEWHHDIFKSKEDLEKKFGKLYELDDQSEAFINDIYIGKDGNRIPTSTRMISQMAQEMGHDGVIIKNIYDVGMYASTNENVSSTIAIAFSPEQVKDIDNINPTSSEDIRYSLDLDDDPFIDIDAYLAGGSVSEDKAVDILEKGMEALKNKEVDVPKLQNLALKLRNEYGSTYNVKTFAENLRKAFAYMQTEDHVDYQTMMGILRDIARPVLEESGELVGEEEYKAFLDNFKGKKIKLTSKQKDEVKYLYGSYKNFRNAMMPITISDNGDMTLDQIWDELVEQSGYVLDRDANEGDMPINLLDTLQAMRPTVRNDFGGDIEDMSKDLAMRIVQEYIEGEASKQMKQEVSEIRARLKKDYQERYKELRGKANAEVLARNKRSGEKAKEREAVRTLKHDIKLNANKLYTWASKPTEGKSIPHDMMMPVMQFLQAIDFVDPVVTYGEDGKYHTKVFDRTDYEDGKKRFIYKDLVGDTREDVIAQFNEAIGKGEGSKEQRSWAEKMQGIRDIYNKVLKDDDFEDNSMQFLMQGLDSQGLAEEFDDLLSRNRGQVDMNHLSSSDLTLINNIIKNIFHAVNQGNKAYSSANVDIVNLAQSTIQDAEGKEIKNRNGILEGIHKMLRLDNVTPRTFFKLLGKRGHEIYKFLRGGLNQEITDLKKASEFMEGAMKGIDAKKWTGRNAVVHEFALSFGSVKMTDGQIMGLYYTLRRNGGMNRISKEGIRVDDIQTKNDKIRRQNPIRLTDADIAKIEAVLTPEQIELGKKMQQYMASDCSDMGNETSMRLYGYKKFTDDTYYPWTVDKDTVPTNNTSENIPMFTGIERSGFTKQLKEGASNPLVIKDIFDVFTDHVAQMAAYHGYAAAVKDTLRWMNYKEKSPDGGIYNKKAINKLVGSDSGVSYITTLLLDINKANKSRYVGNFTDRLIGNYKAAAVGANLRVVAQQPTAYFRALNMIDAKYLLSVNPATAIRNIKRSQEESPISWWKSKGYYETNLGQPIKEIVTGIATPMEKAKDIMMSPAGWADDFTWGFLYTAVEKEQRAKLKGQNISAEQFRKAVNDRFDEIVDNTQVVDSTLHRSQYMRSTDRLNKLQTAFMAEPTKSYNMLLEAVIEDMNDKTAKRTARATTAFLISSLATSAAAAVIDAMRKAKDDDEWWDVWLKNLQENMADNMNPFNLLPVVKDLSAGIYNLMTGQSTFGQSGNRFDIEAISSFMTAAQEISKKIEGESNKTGYGFALTLLKPLSQITGMPVYNLTKDTVALYNTFFKNIETTVNSQTAGRTEVKKEFVKDVDRERSEETLDEGIIDALNHGVSIYDLKGAVQSEYKNKYFDLYTEGKVEEATEVANIAARAYARMGLTDEQIDEIIFGWQEEVVTYAPLDKAIASGENISTEAMKLKEFKDEEKIIKHLVDRYAETLAFEDTHATESHWRENVEKALHTIDPTLDFDDAHEEAIQKKKEQDEKNAIQAHNSEMKGDFFDAVDKKDGSAGRKALEQMKSEGVEAKTVKAAVSSRYHDLWKEAKTQAEKDKAKADWKSAYSLVCNVYGVDSRDLDKTWADWEKKQD